MNTVEKQNLRMRRGNTSTSNNVYRPVLAQEVRCVFFKWNRFGSSYNVRASSVKHKGVGFKPHLPVVGDLAMAPQTGKYFFEIQVTSDNCRIGVCTESAFAKDESLEKEFSPVVKVDPSRNALGMEGEEKEEPIVVALNCQTSMVVLNGKEQKQLWRVVTPAAGSLFSFVVDTDEGVVQLFINKLYAGLVFDTSCKLRGKTLYPCCSLGGLEENNRGLPKGCSSAVVSPPHKFDCLY